MITRKTVCALAAGLAGIFAMAVDRSGSQEKKAEHILGEAEIKAVVQKAASGCRSPHSLKPHSGQ